MLRHEKALEICAEEIKDLLRYANDSSDSDSRLNQRDFSYKSPKDTSKKFDDYASSERSYRENTDHHSLDNDRAYGRKNKKKPSIFDRVKDIFEGDD